ncbi:Tat (twin-arginine translocation) pathway signal sequence [Virgibacillus sp. NKC19-16]|uniref:M14 family zinc carboxypeptidase n=1 Tax=Virgibacillus salidurans TaxID=2831673 RepID=UPI001F435A7B|nr:M14 family zinc carboxypeptidase [Virgibacillus sp. NKC19-16]UJL45941.1 Tat (twin-arginine translocation) pathway signal sequence [Virgibacillus sp. NKC19-16]
MLKKRLFLLAASIFFAFSFAGMVNAAPTDTSDVIGYDEMIGTLENLEEQGDGKLDVFTLREIGIEEGRSEAGRDLYVAKIGNGDKKIWVQGRIHGDEPYGTNATLRIIENLIEEKDNSYKEMMEELTIYFIPMYNPDGAERYERGTRIIDPETGEPGESVDLNRDWVEGNFEAIETLGYYTFWAELKPDFALDIHHQGDKEFYDTDIPVTMSLGITLAPEGPTLSDIEGGEYADLGRQAMVNVYDAVDPYHQFTVNQYRVGPNDTHEVDYRGAVMSGMMLGLNYQGINPEGHSNPAAFLETSGEFLNGEREPLIQQNVIATHAFLSGLASEEMYNIDPDRWDEIPSPPLTGYSTDYDGTISIPEQPAVLFETSAEDINGLVNFYEDEGKVDNNAAQDLGVHSTAVSHFEENGLMEKAAKHMNSFIPLLDYQNENELIADEPYQTLNAYADYLVERWQ